MDTISFNQVPEVVQQANEAAQQANIRLQRIEELIQNHLFQKGHQRDKIYTLQEAAEYCRMPIPTFRAHLSKRNISGSKPGKRWVFRQEDLDKFLQKFHIQTKDEIWEGIDKELRSKKKKA